MHNAARDAGGGFWKRAGQSRAVAVGAVGLFLLVLWYAAAVWLNADLLRRQYDKLDAPPPLAEQARDAWAMKRPRLPAPHQVAVEIYDTTINKRVTSKRSLVYHTWRTLAPTVLGFFFGLALGGLLAVGMIYNRTLERSVLPWLIISQTVPILAIAPMIIVVLAAVGFTGLIPKAMISMYLSFFPVAVSMVKGLRSPDPLQLDLLKTYCAGRWQAFVKLRLPASLPFLFAGLKVAAAASLVGAIVGELPTGAQGGLGARLLSGSYYGQTVQIWAALVAAAALGAMLVYLVGGVQYLTMRRWRA